MDEAEARRLRRGILDDLGAILREDLAADEWGRLLVEVTPNEDGAPTVAGIDVDELFGDEARVDAVFGSEGVRAVLPVLAKAVEALCAIEGLDVEQVRGGTFVRLPQNRFGWLPGLVRAPSARLDDERDDLMARLREKNDVFHQRFGRPPDDRLGLDLASGRIAWSVVERPPMAARATLIGTFAPPSRTWGWGSSNPHAPEPVRTASAALVDAIEDRDSWELTTPVFPTDEMTAWTIAAFVCDRAKGDAVVCARDGEDAGDGLVFVLLRDAR